MTDSLKRLVLIDGHGLAYRQFHGLPLEAFTTMNGEPTNATWGFARTLLDILQAPEPPHYLAVTFDQGMSGRDIVYAGYKSTRDEMASQLVVQMNRIRELVQAFNIPILEKEGFEADDVIGTIARQAVDLGAEVYILTGDRDLLQLVAEHVQVELPGAPNPRGKNSDPKIYDIAAVVERFGVRPDQYVDFKAFVGDPSDNIPGVRGIGDKTAMQLLQQYGTLDNIYAHLDEIKGKRHDLLEQGRGSAFLSQDLSRIKTDIPVELELGKCVAQNYDPAEVVRLFKALEFRSLLNRLPQQKEVPTQQMDLFGMGEPAQPKTVQHLVDTVVVDTPQALADLVNVLDHAAQIAFDTETTGTDQLRCDLVGISLAVSASTGYYIPVGHKSQPERQLPIQTIADALRPALTDPNKGKWAHNATFDLIILRRYGLDVSPITFDTMLAEFLLNPDSRRKGLKDQAEDRLGVQMVHIEDLLGKRGKNQLTMDQVPIDDAAPYAAADAAITYRLVDVMTAHLQENGQKNGLWKLFTGVEIPLIPVIADLDMSGVRLDLPYLAELSTEFAARLNEIQLKIYESAGESFNIGSPKQLNDILFGKLGLPTNGLSKSAHGFSLDAEALDGLRERHEVVALILDWRALDKLKSTYVDSLQAMVDDQGRVHTTYNQTGAVTGRLSSENPNLQNIPIRTEEGRRVRRAFIASPGYHLLSVDYSQIELRILGSFSKDPFLREAFDKDQDVHRATAAAVYNVPFDQITKEQRYFAKRVNFGLMYGMGAHRLARESGLQVREAQDFIERYFQRFPGVKQYFETSLTTARFQGYLETLLGRRRRFAMLLANAHAPHNERARAEREAINMPIQGTAADVIKIAMLRLSERLKSDQPRARLILQVHDELVLEVLDDEIIETAALVREVMENAPMAAMKLSIPLRVDVNVGVNWAEMQSLAEYAAAQGAARSSN